MPVATKISTWGNSEAIRIPRNILREVNVRAGDPVEVRVNDRNNIEISPLQRKHRRVKPEKGISFDTLFPDFRDVACVDVVPENQVSGWPDDDMVGAEYEAWSN